MSVFIKPEINYDGRQIVHSTPRYRGTSTCFSSVDDSQSTHISIWSGSNVLKYHHQVSDAISQNIYMDFNTINNRTYLLKGSMKWTGAEFDEWSCFIVPKVTTTSVSTNTNYNIVNGYLIVPAAGDGTTSIADEDRILVQVTRDEFGNPKSQGFFDAEYDADSDSFINISPNYAGTGSYNMFSTEVSLSTYVNRYVLLGDCRDALTSFDADELGHGLRLKFKFDTIGADHEWKFTGYITMFREKTT